LIHGHVPVSLDFIELLRSSNNFNFIDLDNGIYMPENTGFGNLIALELTSMEMKVQNNLDAF
jgi:serine/threonine protein phosphatase 1